MIIEVKSALSAERVVLSVIGPHAQEDMTTIFARKVEDIRVTGKTFWLYGSACAQPQKVYAFHPAYVLFLTPATKNSARATTGTKRASVFSTDKQTWYTLPTKLSPVTGRAGYALVLSELTLCVDPIELDLWGYCSENTAIRFRLGASTVLAEKKDSSVEPSRMLSRFRRVAAVGKFAEPGAVWVR